MNRFRITFIALLCLVFTAAAFGQSVNATTGGITGKVTDNSGGVLPGVTVTATNVATGQTRSSVTETDGEYLLSLLQPGTYRVDAELAGLGRASLPRVTVLLGTNTKSDLLLNPTVSESVTVTATAPVVDPTQSGQTTSVTEKQIENLPILSRDFRSLATLTPGVSEAFGGRVQANGGRGITTDYNIDGANANSEFFGEQTGGTRAPFTFSQAAIKEFQVIRSQYNAEYGRGVGATMNAITKSGTNDVDGEVFTFLRKKSWASTRPTTINGLAATESFRAKDSLQPGFAIGGPIVRDRFFYFVNADAQRQKLPIIATDFTTRTGVGQFGALAPDVQQAFFARFQAITGHPFSEELNYDQSFDQNTYLVKFDANFGSNTHASLRDNYSDFHNQFNQTGFQLASNQGDEHDKFNQLVGQAETVFTNTLFNQIILQYEKQERPIDPIASGYPEVSVTQGTGSAVFGNLNFLANNTSEKKIQLKDSLTYMLGTHTFKGGVEYLQDKFVNNFPRYLHGRYEYASVAAFLAGTPSRFRQAMGPTSGNTPFDQSTWGVFVQDSFKPIDRLTLDLGVRYERQDMPGVTLAGPAVNHPEFEEGLSGSRSSTAPRFGFAYDLLGTGRTVLRGGTGKFFNFLPAILLANPLAQVSGGFTDINIACTTASPCPTFPNLFTPAQFAAQPAASNAIQFVSPDFKPQQSWRSSLQLVQQIGRQYSVGVSGEYAKLTNVQGKYQANATPTGVVLGGVPVYTIADPNRPYKEYGSVLVDYSGEKASNRSFTVETHKLALENSKLSWDAHYTWSKSFDQESNERSTSTSFLFDPFNPSLSQGFADFDIRHRIVLDATYELPYGILVAGIFNWRSGAPYTRNIFCNCGGQGVNGLINQSGNIPVWIDANGDVIDLTQFLNGTSKSRAQFADFLNSRGAHLDTRNGFRQPAVKNMDARVSKRFNLIRGAQIELIGEVFNVLNTKNLFVITNNQTLYTLNYNATTDRFTSITPNGTFGIPSSYNTAVDPRQFQIAAKIIF
jgi:outer membrane receptor protein involved in Fe transport